MKKGMIALLGCVMSVALLAGCGDESEKVTESVGATVESSVDEESAAGEAETISTSEMVEATEAPTEPTEAPVEATEAPVESTEAPAEATEAPVEPTEAPAEPTKAPVAEAVTVYPALDYPEDDWRSGGLYINGNYAKIPMTYKELYDLGFVELERTNGSKADVSAKLPAYSYALLNNYTAYNGDKEEVGVRLVNETGEAKALEECVVFSLSFATPDYEQSLGYGELCEVSLCNDISWESTYDDIITKMGEPSESQNLSDTGEAFSGTMKYYIEEGNRHRYIEFSLFEGGITNITYWVLPIDAKVLW